MQEPAKTNQDLLEEIALLKQRIHELEISVSDSPGALDALRDKEQQLYDIAEKIPGVIYQFYAKPTGGLGLNYVSERSQSIFELDNDPKVFFQRFSARVAPESINSFTESITEAVNDVKPWRYEGRFIKDSGEPIWFLGLSNPVRKEHEIIFNGVLLDITERKLAEEAQKSSELKYRSIFEDAFVGIYLSTPDGRYITVNPAFARIAGFESADEMIRSITDIGQQLYINPDERKQLGDILRRDDRVEGFEAQIRRNDGERIWVLINAHTIRDHEGNILYYEGTCLDITGRKQAEEALLASEKKYRDLIQKIQAAVVVHGADTQIQMCNQLSQDLLGLTEEQLLGKQAIDPGWHFFREDGTDMPLEEYPVNRVMVTRKPFWNAVAGIHRPTKKDEVWVLVSADPVFDEKDDLTQIIVTFFDITERKRMEKILCESEEMYRQLTESMHDMIVTVDFDFNITYGNKAAFDLAGGVDSVGKNALDFTSPDMHELQKAIMQKRRDGFSDMLAFEWDLFFPGGAVRTFDVKGTLLTSDGKPSGVMFVGRDISERKQAQEEKMKLEAQLTQAQKMEFVGRLAGGVAHDFNNMLSVILGNTEMAINTVHPSEPLHKKLQAVLHAGQRSADLTRQLLAFARKQTISPRVLDLNEALNGMSNMLQRLIGEDIDIAWLPSGELWPVNIDPSQIDQILANLCINARDAIKGVGKITIETANATFDDSYCRDHEEFVPGQYVLLAVSDNGCGMDKEILGKLFEPFFTTKETGKGTGLGLCTIYGIVKQNKGFINVYSEPGHGTTFKIYFPRYEGKDEISSVKGNQASVISGRETVLVVEDEPALLEMSKLMLEMQGYKVLSAASPREAIRLSREHSGKIDLLMTDVVMPEMNGRDLAENMLTLYPDLKCLFTSGYTANVIAHRGVLEEGVHFIQKPFSRNDLAMKVREVLDNNH
jgi:two-component system, cell cycle sensor histidine kinase and response regulator CckA